MEQGTLIDGRYVVEGLLGQGGLAEVYRVRHAELGSLHALKLLTWKSRSLEERLLLEGRIQAQLRHPNVVAVTDLVRHNSQFGLLMEFVDHETLEDLLVREAPLSIDMALDLFSSILAGIAAAHDAGVLHRDLKPANVLLAREGRRLVPKVADFGIAKVVEEARGGRTAAGVTMGTPGYLAPEQILDSADTDARADVFALGAILYEMVSGKQAFADDGGEVSVRSTLEGVCRPLAEVAPNTPGAICDAVARALERNREGRFPDCRSFGAAVLDGHPMLLQRLSETGTGRTLDTAPGMRSGPTIEPESHSSPPTFAEVRGDTPVAAPRASVTKRSRGLAPLLIVGGAVLTLVAGLVLVSGQSVEEPAPRVIETRGLIRAEVPPANQQAPTAEPVAELQAADAPPKAAPRPADPGPVGASTGDNSLDVSAPSPDGDLEEGGPGELKPVADAAEEPSDDAVVEANVAPPPEPEAEKPAQLVVPMLRVGFWKGVANGRPLELRIGAVDGENIRGELTFYLGPTARTVPAEGTVNNSTGQLTIRGGDYVLSGAVDGSSMSGTYSSGKKPLPWKLDWASN